MSDGALKPGVLFESMVLKRGGFNKKGWTPREAAVVDVAEIGRVFQWKKPNAATLQHWIAFNLIERVQVKRGGGPSYGTLIVTTRWLSYEFQLSDEQVCQGWERAFGDKYGGGLSKDLN